MKIKAVSFLFLVSLFFIADCKNVEAYTARVYIDRGRSDNTVDVTIDKASYSPGEQIRLRSVVMVKPGAGIGGVIVYASVKINGISRTVLTNYSVVGDSYNLIYTAENIPGTYFVEIVPNASIGFITTPSPARFSYVVVPLPVNGSCGSSNGVASFSAPTSNFCSSGAYSGTSGSGPWSWSCIGSNGGSTASCSTPLAAGNCGASNGQYLYSAPASGLCTTGTASTVSGSGPWSWTCNGTACSANKKYDCNNICSSLYSYTQAMFQSSDAACTSPITPPTYSMNCTCGVKASDPFGYTPVCAPPVNGVCGTDNGDSFLPPAAPTNLCSSGTSDSFISNIVGWTWNCLGSNGGMNATNCTAAKIIPVDGVCGDDNGKTLADTPTNLCLTGSASAVSGTGPWTWNCNGFAGGSNVSCSAQKSITVNATEWREVSP